MASIEAKTAALYSRNAQLDANALIGNHLQLVRKIAWHVHGRVSSAIDIADLVQIGMVALVEAAHNYEDRGFAFATYATMRIRGAMVDQLRRSANICRSGIAKRRELTAARKRLEDRLGRSATEAELAQDMGMDPVSFRMMLDDTVGTQMESIDEVYSDHSMWFATSGEAADEGFDRARLAEQLSDQIKLLPEREAMILNLYFIEEMNLHEIGEVMGITAARVCQIKKSALDKLRERLSDED